MCNHKDYSTKRGISFEQIFTLFAAALIIFVSVQLVVMLDKTPQFKQGLIEHVTNGGK